jgi:hypothetical protein
MAKRKRVTAHALAKHLQDVLNAREIELQYARRQILVLTQRIEELESGGKTKNREKRNDL